MSSVDNRVVAMNFDNTVFERRLSATVSSLEKLQKTLELAGAKRGLEDVASQASKFNLGSMSTHIEGVSAKFLALSTIAVTALSTITSAAIRAGTRIVSAFSLDPINDGFREYETNMNSIQTILANTDSKGTTLSEVNEALDQMNTYSDQTIYNFAEMARNVGTFTAAGVGLDQSVSSIKGIANIAAISGSNSQQASTAMYQLSQALAAGSVKLMDWNSVVNAGMGGEVFKKALFETGKALGTIADTPIDTTFEDWEASGVTFRESLEQGWITADVLTNTLQSFTGDLTSAQLMSMGYTEAQAAEMIRLGALGKAAATEVKTLTQLISTVKESVASGWSQSFRTIFGDFEQAKELFTGINDAIGGFVGRSADARNALLQGWADMGGRSLTIQALKNGFYALGRVLEPIGEAFRRVFPKKTSDDLFEFTQKFAGLMQKLIPSQDTIEKIGWIFRGLFGALKLGIEIVKGIAGVFGDLFSHFLGGNGGAVLTYLAELGERVFMFTQSLYRSNKITDFFDDITAKIIAFSDTVAEVIEFFVGGFTGDFTNEGEGLLLFANQLGMAIGAAKDIIVEFFGAFEDFSVGGFDRVTDRFKALADLNFASLDLGPLQGFFDAVVGLFDEIWTHISTWFSELGGKLADAAEPGDFDAVVDVVNVGLLGGLVAILGKFFKDGLKLDFGDGLLNNISKSFDQLTSTLSAMQTEIKANALLKIAGAVALLTASVLVLSLIDSAALTKALAAMAIGFTQLIGAFAILTKLSVGPSGAASLVVLTTSLTVLAGALLILSVAIKILSTMSWEELAKGLGAVIVLLGALIGAAALLSKIEGGMIRASVALIAIAVAIGLLAVAMKIFATMSWEELGKGLAGVGGGLALIVAAMHLMPDNMFKTAAGLVLIGVALNLIAVSMKIFATMSWEEMGKGMLGLGGGLLLIAGAMKLMPEKQMLKNAAALILVGVAVNLIATALKVFGSMSWEEMARGLAGMAGALVVLALATMAMSGSLLGAAAIAVVAFSLGTLFTVLKEFGNLSFAEIGMGLLSIALVLGALAAGAILLGPAIVPMLALGAALFVLGAGFALFGLGAQAVAKAFEILAKAGSAGIGVLMELIDAIIKRIPDFVKAMAKGIIELAMVFIEAAPILIEGLGIVIAQLLDTFIELIPKFAETLGELISALLTLLREKTPEFIETGLVMLMSFLQGISDNIEEITQAVIDIVVKFVETIASNMGDIVTAGATLLAEFLRGIAENIGMVVTAVADIIVSFITAVVGEYGRILTAGADALAEFLRGIANNLGTIITTVVDIITQLITDITSEATRLLTAGATALAEFLQGIADNLSTILSAAVSVITQLITDLGIEAARLVDAGLNAIITFLEGVATDVDEFVSAAISVFVNFVSAMNDNFWILANAAIDIVIDFMNAIADSIEDNIGDFRAAGGRIAWAIADGMSFGLLGFGAKMVKGGANLAGNIIDGVKDKADIDSPSKVFKKLGQYMVAGLALGLREDKSVVNGAGDLADRVISSYQSVMKELTFAVDNVADINPTITPVLDLTNLQRDSKQISGLVSQGSLSYMQAGTIAASRTAIESSAVDSDSQGGIKFEQNIFAPTELSTSDIYRQTRNQINLAKEELSIP